MYADSPTRGASHPRTACSRDISFLAIPHGKLGPIMFMIATSSRRLFVASACLNNGSYILGAFLLGAYQEILGDLHNLFGDTNAVHVSLDQEGYNVLETVVKKATLFAKFLITSRLQLADLHSISSEGCELAVREQRIDL